MGVIYKLTSPSGKFYIGQTKQPFALRWSGHKRSARKYQHKCWYLESAIRKHGAENFKTEVLVECDDEMLNEFEKRFVKQYSSDNSQFGYNLTSGGADNFEMNSMVRNHMSESHRKKHGNDLPKYIIKTGCKKAGVSGYQITNHPKCKRKRFTGEIKDDANSLQRAIKYLEKLEKGEIKKKEKLPQYVSYMKGHDSYSVQIPRKDKPNLRKEFRDKKLTRDERRQKAIEQLEKWKLEYNIE